MPWLIFWYFKAATLALLKVKIDATAPFMYRWNCCNCSWKKIICCWQGHGAIAAHCGWRRRVRRGTDHAGSAAVATLEFYGTEFGVLDDCFRLHWTWFTKRISSSKGPISGSVFVLGSVDGFRKSCDPQAPQNPYYEALHSSSWQGARSLFGDSWKGYVQVISRKTPSLERRGQCGLGSS